MTTEEQGQVVVLAAGLAVVCFAIAGLAVDGTRAFLARRSLQSAADAAVVAAASEIDAARYYRSGGADVMLSTEAAETVATRLFGERALPGSTSVAVTRESVVLIARSRVETSFLKLVGIDVIPVAVSARAEPFRQAVPLDR